MSVLLSNQIYTGFVPTQVATCALWLDGYDQNSFTFAGNVVSRWNDKSGSNYNGTSITGSPIYTAAAINGRNAVAFNGSSAINGSNANTGTTLTCFAVGIMSNTVEPYGRMFSVLGVGPEDRNADSANVIGVAAGAQAVFSYRNYAALGQANITYGTAFQACTLFNGSTQIMYVNGNAGTSANTTGSFGYTTYSVGQGSSSYWKGFIGEIILYSGALSTSNRQTVEGYLAQKWGLTAYLPNGHPGLTSNIFNVSLYLPKVPLQALPYSATYSPLQVPGCALWLDASTSNSITFTSGTNVASWLDKSGNGRNATQATASNQPHWTDNNINGIVFNGTAGECLNLPSLSFTSISIFMVAQATTYSYGSMFLSLTAGTGIYLRSFNGTAPGPTYDSYGIDYGGATYRYAPSSAVVDTDRHLWSFTLPASGLGTFTWDGNAGNNAGGFTFANISTTFPTPSIGAYGQTPTSSPLTGYIHEILMYSNDLTTTNRQTIESYLAEKWKLTSNLPTNHPNFTTPAGRPPVVTALLGPPQRTLITQLPPLVFATVFTYTTGVYQYYTVPSGITSVTVLMWGAGGGGLAGYTPCTGGSGACIQGSLAVTPGETLTIVVGYGGQASQTGTPTDAMGGGGSGYNGNRGYGGGRSAIQRTAGTDVVTVGGGGGSDMNSYRPAGAASASGTAYQGNMGGKTTAANGSFGGGGGQSSGGIGGTQSGYTGTNGTKGFGGSSGRGGGGGGYYGGGGAGGNNTVSGESGSGGGGSSFIDNLTNTTLWDGYGVAGNAARLAPNSTSPYWNNYALGGTYAANAGNGAVILSYTVAR